jgi:polyhydroxybutyrate depolymerase
MFISRKPPRIVPTGQLLPWGLCAGLMLGTVGARQAGAQLQHRTWNVDGVEREALVHVPTTATTMPTAIVFAFHGHGGTAQRVARAWNYQGLWPQAIVVYMQGLKTPGQITDPEGTRTGWQRTVGDQQDRDLKFLDAVLASLEREYQVDKRRIYATGHSNGGSFTYLLWEARPNTFAAFAPSAAVKRPLVTKGARPNPGFVPRPALIIAGRADPLVKFAWQQGMIDALLKLNECGTGQPWKEDPRLTMYPSSVDAPVVTYIHSGGHVVPQDAPALIVKFFKAHATPDGVRPRR